MIDKWFAGQATSSLPGTSEQVRTADAAPRLRPENPHRVYALIRGFCDANPRHFHAAGGSGYAWAAEAISELQAMNSQVASRHARAALECIAAIDGLGE